MIPSSRTFAKFSWERAHFWNGRICQELGQIGDAKGIYEEVAAYDERNIADVNETRLATAARGRKKTGTEEFFADNEQYLLQTLFQLDKKDYLEEVQSWRTTHKASSEKCYGYQALTFEYAKNLQAIGEQSKDAATKEKFKRDALRVLGEMAKIPSPYQEGAAKLRRLLNPNATPEEGFEYAVIDGDAALEKKKWAQAVECYKKAVASASTKTDQARLAAVQNTLVACYHNLAMQFYQQGKIDDAINTAKEALKGRLLKTKAAPGVGVFLLNVLYYQYVSAAEKTDEEKKAKAELLTKVSNTAKSILNVKDWAAKQEGDAARIVLLRLALAKENMPEADRVLAEINPDSKEYPKALTVMGFAHWFKYKMAKKALEKVQDADKAKIAQRDEHRKLALDYIERAVKAQDGPRGRRACSRFTPRIADAAGGYLHRRRRLQEGRCDLQVFDRPHPQGSQQTVRRNGHTDLQRYRHRLPEAQRRGVHDHGRQQVPGSRAGSAAGQPGALEFRPAARQCPQERRGGKRRGRSRRPSLGRGQAEVAD